LVGYIKYIRCIVGIRRRKSERGEERGMGMGGKVRVEIQVLGSVNE